MDLPGGALAVVIGGGIAGTTAACALAQAGLRVTLMEKAGSLATAASGNLAGALLPNPSLKPNLQELFLDLAFQQTLSQIEVLSRAGFSFDWRPGGVVHLPVKRRIRRICDQLRQNPNLYPAVSYLTPEEAAAKSGLSLKTDALFYPEGGSLFPPDFCRAFSELFPISLKTYHRVTGLEYSGRQWLVHSRDSEAPLRADVVVLANGYEALDLEQSAWMPLASARGQVAYLPLNSFSRTPSCVICFNGYLIPNLEDCHLLGASLDYANTSAALNPVEQAQLVEDAASCLPGFQAQSELIPAGRVSFRTNSPDHLPLVGPLPDLDVFQEQYADLHHGRRKTYPPAPCLPGLYCSLGHGSRGLITAWPAARLLAAAITGGVPNLPLEVRRALNPARFIIRSLKRSPHLKITRLFHPKT